MKKLLVILIVIFVSLSLTSCTQSERITDLTVVEAVGFDTKKDTVLASVQYLNLYSGTGQNKGVNSNITATVFANGKSIYSALDTIDKKLPDRLFFGQTKLIVVSEEFENKYKDELVRYLCNTRYSRADIYIVKTKKTAQSVITKAQKNTRVPADSIVKQLKKNNRAVNVNEYLGGRAAPTV